MVCARLLYNSADLHSNLLCLRCDLLPRLMSGNYIHSLGLRLGRNFDGSCISSRGKLTETMSGNECVSFITQYYCVLHPAKRGKNIAFQKRKKATSSEMTTLYCGGYTTLCRLAADNWAYTKNNNEDRENFYKNIPLTLILNILSIGQLWHPTVPDNTSL